jgi:hypothetical protein
VSASSIPPCRSLGSQCQSLKVTLRIGELEEGPASLDHEATWLLGHTAQMDFLELWEGEGDLYVEAVLHVPCRYLHQDGARARCRAHGYDGPAPRGRRRPPQPLQLGGDRFVVVDNCENAVLRLPLPPRSLPVLANGTGSTGENPVRLGALPHRRQHAQGRLLPRPAGRDHVHPGSAALESLVRSRRSPYLCKIERAGDYSLEVEMISACGYLEGDGISCSLHGRHRADGRTAKPDLCFEWPPKNRGLHPGCVFAPRRRARRR